MAHIRQSRPDSGLSFLVEVLETRETIDAVPSYRAEEHLGHPLAMGRQPGGELRCREELRCGDCGDWSSPNPPGVASFGVWRGSHSFAVGGFW